ncbi:MAG TPA: SIMPL domain-containing protein, partial [Dehalococcoidales bacterium]
MRKVWLLALGLGLALVLAVFGLAACTPGTTSVESINLKSQQEGIWVTGQGKVTVVPDIAILQLGIEAQAATVAQAQTQAAQGMD